MSLIAFPVSYFWTVNATQTQAAFTLQVLMHKSDLLTISDVLARQYTFTLDMTGIWYLCLH